MNSIVVKIKEHSWLARIAARCLKAGSVAIVVGNTIYLYNTSRQDFLKNIKWVRHEIAHVRQYENHGKTWFIMLYILESFNKGYHHNRFEVEARQKEDDASILRGIRIV